MPSHSIIRTLLTILAALFVIPAAQAQEPAQIAEYGINFYAPKDWNRMQPFLNHMKVARPWISHSDSSWNDKRPFKLDKDGYVMELLPGQQAGTIMLTNVTPSFPNGEYVFLYEGEGTFEWKGNGRLISEEPGRQVVKVQNTDKGFVHMIVKSVNPDNYPRNMRFVNAKYENNWEKLYYAPWMLKYFGNATTFRFMDLMLANHSEQKEWSDRPVPSMRTYWKKGISVEDIIRLCNQAKRNAWVNLPHLATDEYIRETAKMFRDHLDPSLTVYYEFSNEVWNGMFSQTRYANEMGQKEGLATENWKAGLIYHAKQSNRMFKILDEVYAGQPKHRYDKVLAVQGGNIGAARIVVESLGVADNADSLAIAPYLTFNVPMKPLRWKKTPIAEEVQTWNLDQVFAYLKNEALPECTKWMDEQKALADKHGLKLIAYEGGQHLTALGEVNKNKTIVDLLADANRDPRMGELYTAYFNHWTDIGAGLFCVFNAMQPYSEAGSWGLLEYVGEDPTTSPKYMAIQEWAERVNKK